MASDPISLALSEGLGSQGANVVCPDIELEITPSSEVTPEQIEDAYETAVSAGFDPELAAEYRDAALSRYVDAGEPDPMPENPTYLDVSGEGFGEWATLYGVVQRVDITPSDTHSALGGALCFLVFDKPITITYNGPIETETREYARLQIGGTWMSTAEDRYLAEHPSELETSFDDDVGRRVAVTGHIYDAGTIYYIEGAAMIDQQIEFID